MDKKEKTLRDKISELVKEFYQLKHVKSNFTKGSRIPYAGRVFDHAEIQNAVNASLDFWLTAGPYCDRLEKELSSFLGVKYVSLTNSGSSANLLAFSALTSPKLGARRINKGDEVITVAAGFPTTVTPIIQYGAIPVFIDVTLDTYNIDVTKLEAAISSKTKAVLIAHTLGNPFDLKSLKDFCTKHNLWLIEDNCDALGAQYKINNKWAYTGTIGDLGTSSFYPPHHMTTGEGGAIYTNNHQLKILVDSFRDWGRDCSCKSGEDNSCGRRFTWQLGELPMGYDHKYVYSHFGYNLKMTDIQAAIGLAQLKKLPNFIKARIKNHETILKALKNYEKFFILPKATLNSMPSPFGFLLTLKEKTPFTRDDIVNHLENEGVQTRMLFSGNLIKHPCFDELRKDNTGYRVIEPLINTDIIMNKTFWIGVYPGLDNDMLKHMIQSIKSFLEKY